MNAAQQLAKSINCKAKELQTTNSFLLCALQVIHTHLHSLDAIAHRNEMDGYIAYALTKQLIEDLTVKAKNNLMSAEAEKMQQGSHAIELMNETDLDYHPEYKAYKPILQSIIGGAPVLRLHLMAAAMAAGITRSLRSKYNKATVTEIILNHCSEEINNYATAAVMAQSGFYGEQMPDTASN